MPVPEMPDVDKAELQRLCGGVIPEATVAKYWRVKAEVTVKYGGQPMRIETLLWIADSTGAWVEPKKALHACHDWPLNCCVVCVNQDTRTTINEGLFKGIDEDGDVRVSVKATEMIHTFNAKNVKRVAVPFDWARNMDIPEPAHPEPIKPADVVTEVKSDEEITEEEKKRRALADRLARHGFRQFAEGTRMLINVPMTGPTRVGWFVRIDPVTCLKVRLRWEATDTLPVKEEDTLPQYAAPIAGPDGKPFVDLEGYIASGAKAPVVAVVEETSAPDEAEEFVASKAGNEFFGKLGTDEADADEDEQPEAITPRAPKAAPKKRRRRRTTKKVAAKTEAAQSQ